MIFPIFDAGVRPARSDDVDAIGRVHVRSWGAFYGDLFFDFGVPTLAPQSLAQFWRAAVASPPSSQHCVLVAMFGADVVGFVAVAPGTDADARFGHDAEVLVLLVDPDQQHAGHGSRLLNAAADTLRDSGFGVLRSWLPEDDTDCLAFLTGAGFAFDGASRVLDVAGDGTTTVREVRLTAALRA